MPKTVEIHLPDIGDFADVPIIEISVAPGDMVDEGDTLLAIESDKATLDVPTEVSGMVLTIEVSEGDYVSQGTLIATLEVAEEADSDAAPQLAVQTPPSPVPTEPQPKPQQRAEVAPAAAPVQAVSGKAVHASPSIRRLARVLGVDIGQVGATGPKGRILREDIEAFVKGVMTGQSKAGAPSALASLGNLPPWPQVDHAKFGPIERVKLSRIAKLSGPSLSRNATIIPHVSNSDKADITDLEEFRKKMNAEAGPEEEKLTILAFAVKAVVSALQAYPKFNSSLEGEELVFKQYWNIGVAADTPGGLVVPVIKNADRKGLREIAAEIKELAGAARGGKLKSEDMQGATFTISSLGGIGSTNFTSIISAPEVAILGMPRSEIQPVWDGAEFKPRLIQPFTVSFDHRAVDGVASAHFLAHIAKILSDFRRLTL